MKKWYIYNLNESESAEREFKIYLNIRRIYWEYRRDDRFRVIDDHTYNIYADEKELNEINEFISEKWEIEHSYVQKELFCVGPKH